MEEHHTALVLRTASPYAGRVILLDERLGKIEAFPQARLSFGRQLFHGALISCSLKKRGSRYSIEQSVLLDTPSFWVGKHFLFFHHVLELCAVFLSFDEQAPEVFSLMLGLYKDPESVSTHKAQKLFLCQFFKLIGMYSDQEYENINAWLHACIQEHPQAFSLNTVSFLTTLDMHEEAV